MNREAVEGLNAIMAKIEAHKKRVMGDKYEPPVDFSNGIVTLGRPMAHVDEAYRKAKEDFDEMREKGMCYNTSFPRPVFEWEVNDEVVMWDTIHNPNVQAVKLTDIVRVTQVKQLLAYSRNKALSKDYYGYFVDIVDKNGITFRPMFEIQPDSDLFYNELMGKLESL